MKYRKSDSNYFMGQLSMQKVIRIGVGMYCRRNINVLKNLQATGTLRYQIRKRAIFNNYI